MTASVAFDRRKFADKTINWGEGLVGRCGLEKETILITDVPNDYIHITSGLGGANPGTILLVPLKSNDELYGVIELASFQILQTYEIELVEKSAESIASTIAMLKKWPNRRKSFAKTSKKCGRLRKKATAVKLSARVFWMP